jgi:hypothetical protein
MAEKVVLKPLGILHVHAAESFVNRNVQWTAEKLKTFDYNYFLRRHFFFFTLKEMLLPAECYCVMFSMHCICFIFPKKCLHVKQV